MKKGNSGRKLLIGILIVMVSFFLAGIFVQVKQQTMQIDKKIEKVNNGRNELQKSLYQQTSIGKWNLSNKSQVDLWQKNVKKLAGAQFFGAYVGVLNNKVVLADKRGLANASTENPFSLESVFFVGDYQDTLNTVMLVELVKDKKINLSKKVSSYLKIKNGSINVRDLLTGETNFYIEKKYVDHKAIDQKYDLKRVTQKKSFHRNYVSANNILKMFLIEKTSGTDYNNALSKYIIQPAGLMNTRLYNPNNKLANDVIGYKRQKKEGRYVQSKSVPIEMNYSGITPLRMSISDILITINFIQNNGYFSRGYNKLFSQFVKGTPFTFDSDGCKLTTKKSGHYLALRANSDGSKIALTVANYPNKTVSVYTENNLMYSILNEK